MAHHPKIYGNTRDFAGVLIQKGDIIAYGQAFDRSAGLNMAVVLDAYQLDTDRVYDGQKVFEARLSIFANQDTWKAFPERDPKKGKWDDSFPNKKTTLKFSDRCVVMHKDSIPPSALGDYYKQVAAAVIADDKALLEDLGVLC